jgi:hypothetical protein
MGSREAFRKCSRCGILTNLMDDSVFCFECFGGLYESDTKQYPTNPRCHQFKEKYSYDPITNTWTSHGLAQCPVTSIARLHHLSLTFGHHEAWYCRAHVSGQIDSGLAQLCPPSCPQDVTNN